MFKKIMIIIIGILIILPVGYGIYVSYENNKYEKNLDKEATETLSDNEKSYYNELYTTKDKSNYLKMSDNVKNRNKDIYDDDYLVEDTENVDLKNIEDGVYLTYDSSDDKNSSIVREYYKEQDRPRLIIMNKGIEQGYIQFYNVYKKLKGLDSINSTDFPNGFYVRNGKIVKEYKGNYSKKELPDNSLEELLQEEGNGGK